MIGAIRKNAVLFGIPVKEAVTMRLRFLKSRMDELHGEVAEYSVPSRREDAWAVYCLRECRRELEALEREAKALVRFLRQGACQEGSALVSKETITAARSYPFGKLLAFKGRMTRCPFHDDRHPSMALYGNRVRCFVCNRSWDTIEFLMERDGLSFRSAVRHLAGDC